MLSSGAKHIFAGEVSNFVLFFSMKLPHGPVYVQNKLQIF